MHESNQEINNQISQDSQTPAAATSGNETLVAQLNALQKELAELKASKTSKNNTDAMTEQLRAEGREAYEKAQQEKLTNSLVEITSDFKGIFGGKADELLKSIAHISDPLERANAMAKQIIRKAFGDTESVNAKLDSCKRSVLDTDSAFHVEYHNAKNKLKQDYIGANNLMFAQGAKGSLSTEDTSKLVSDVLDYRTKERAIQKYKTLTNIN